MSESGLSIGLSGLRREVAYYLGKGRDSANWSREDVEIFDSHIRAGLRLFYNPVGHSWSFFKPYASVLVAQGAKSMALPDDFGFAIGDIVASKEDGTSKWYLRKTSIRDILLQKERVGMPGFYAIAPRQMDDVQAQGQRFEIYLYPTPIEQCVLGMRYSVVPGMISTERPYPYGGMQHSETIREACLAKAEEDSDDNQGVHAKAYQERLAASIAYDMNVTTPDNLGYNADSAIGTVYRKSLTINLHNIVIGGGNGATPAASAGVGNWIIHN